MATTGKAITILAMCIKTWNSTTFTTTGAKHNNANGTNRLRTNASPSNNWVKPTAGSMYPEVERASISIPALPGKLWGGKN